MSTHPVSQSFTTDSKVPAPTSETSTACNPNDSTSRPAVPLAQLRDMSSAEMESQQKQPDGEPANAAEPEPIQPITAKKDGDLDNDTLPKTKSKGKKTKCKHQHKNKKSETKKSAKKASKEQDSGSSTSSDDSSDSNSSSSSSSPSSSSSEDSSDDERTARKKKRKNKKSKKSKKDGKKLKGIDWGTDDEDSEDEAAGTTNKKKLKKLLKKGQKDKKRRKAKKEAESSDASDAENSSDEASDSENDLQAQIDDLKMQLAAQQLKGGQKRRSSSISLRSIMSGKKDNKKKTNKKNPGFQRVDQLWDNELHNYKLKESAEDDENEFAEYAFLVRRCFNWENRYTETVVDIKSKQLRTVLVEVMKHCKSVALEAEEPTIDPNTLFLYLEEFRTHYKKTLKAKIKATKKQKATKKLTVQRNLCKTLVKYLDADYADIKKTLYPLLEAGTITFELLWALYKPNEIAITSCYGSWNEPRCFKVDYANKFSTMSRGEWYCVEGRYLEYDGKSFGWAEFEVDCEAFKGPRKITSLATYPLKYHREPDVVKKTIVERGELFVSTEGMQYKAMKGLAFMKKKKQVAKININGRIMVDPATFRRVNANYPIGNITFNDQEGLISGEEGEYDSDSCGCCGDSDDEGAGGADQQLEQYDHSKNEPKYKYKWVMDKDGRTERFVRVEVDENGDPIKANRVDKLTAEVDGKHAFTEEELLLTSPVVLGFAFSEKLWLEFSLSGVQDITYNESAFDSLVLPPNQKEIVRALVESHKSNGAKAIDDVVVGKGQALNCILHGPPGTGKTLTAESISELLHCPLYMVSAGELGVDPGKLEYTLQQILDIAHSWGAILLIDEADVFLEARELHDLQRNALVSIFLRLLEYYQGILILTTNRVNTFDDAFQSRIHVALRYGELSKAARLKVWKMFIDMVQKNEGSEAVTLPASEYEALSRHSLNGRQIKNLVKSAQSLALYEKKPMSMEHIKKVLEVAETFDRDLKGGTGYIDAMRSYT